MEQVNSLDPKADQLPPPQPRVGSYQHQRAKARVDHLSQGGDLGDGGDPHLGCPLGGRSLH
jgi:hypothetical protein